MQAYFASCSRPAHTVQLLAAYMSSHYSQLTPKPASLYCTACHTKCFRSGPAGCASRLLQAQAARQRRRAHSARDRVAGLPAKHASRAGRAAWTRAQSQAEPQAARPPARSRLPHEQEAQEAAAQLVAALARRLPARAHVHARADLGAGAPGRRAARYRSLCVTCWDSACEQPTNARVACAPRTRMHAACARSKGRQTLAHRLVSTDQLTASRGCSPAYHTT